MSGGRKRTWFGSEASVPDVATGTALGERRALDAKRIAKNLIEALCANDVGKLLDQTRRAGYPARRWPMTGARGAT